MLIKNMNEKNTIIRANVKYIILLFLSIATFLVSTQVCEVRKEHNRSEEFMKFYKVIYMKNMEFSEVK